MDKLEEFFVDVKKEFGLKKDNEDFEQISSIPMDFSSSCWHNNESPSLSFDGNCETENGDCINCSIFICSKNPELRPYYKDHQFVLQIDGGGKGYYYEYLSNSWQDIVLHAENAKEILKSLIDNANKKDLATAFKETAKIAKNIGFSFWE